MKTAKLSFAALLLSANIVATHTPASADEIPGLVLNEESAACSYCCREIMAQTTQSLAGQQPLLKRPNSGEVIDYYGPCGETPDGQDQPDAQLLDQYRWGNNYTD